jgi:uncharacterized membrane protein
MPLPTTPVPKETVITIATILWSVFLIFGLVVFYHVVVKPHQEKKKKIIEAPSEIYDGIDMWGY